MNAKPLLDYTKSIAFVSSKKQRLQKTMGYTSKNYAANPQIHAHSDLDRSKTPMADNSNIDLELSNEKNYNSVLKASMSLQYT